MESYWVTQLGRFRNVVSHVVHDLTWRHARRGTKARQQELIQAVLDFGKMKYQLYKTEVTIVDETELAFRFRETTHAITRTLALLERQGLAERTDLPRLWKLNVADLDQQSRVVSSAGAMSKAFLHVSEK